MKKTPFKPHNQSPEETEQENITIEILEDELEKKIDKGLGSLSTFDKEEIQKKINNFKHIDKYLKALKKRNPDWILDIKNKTIANYDFSTAIFPDTNLLYSDSNIENIKCTISGDFFRVPKRLLLTKSFTCCEIHSKRAMQCQRGREFLDNNIINCKYGFSIFDNDWDYKFKICQELRQCLAHIKERDKNNKSSPRVDIKINVLVDQLNKQNWKDFRTGERFDLSKDHLIPSIDRITNSINKTDKAPYTKDNIIIVSRFYNFLKNTLSEKSLYELCYVINNNIDLDEKEYEIGIKNRIHEVSKNRKMIKKDRPVCLAPLQTVLFLKMKELKTSNTVKLVKLTNISRGSITNAMEKLSEYGAIEIIKKNTFEYNFIEKTDYNLNRKYTCSNCKKKQDIYDFGPRKSRSTNSILLNAIKEYNQDEYCQNMFNKMCKDCCTKSTTKSRIKQQKPKNAEEILDKSANFIFKRIKNNCRTPRENDPTHSKIKKCQISLEDIKDIIKNQDYRCAISGCKLIFNKTINFNMASPDRIDNDKDYSKDNIHIVCYNLNLAKKDYDISNEEVIQLIKKCKYFVNESEIESINGQNIVDNDETQVNTD